MTFTAEQTLPIPIIVVTPALPSRDSLPADMRSVLDSIVGGECTESHLPDTARQAEDGVVRPDEVDVTCARSHDDDDAEVPHTPLPTHPVSADTHYRLELDLECTRFSLGDTLSALYTRYCGAGGPDPTPEADLVVDSDGLASAPSANPSLTCGSGFLVVTEDMAHPSSDDVASDAGSASLRRVPPDSGECPPTWRHAMYISSLVWPAQRNREGGKAQRDKPLPPVESKSRWCGVPMDSLARTFRIRR